MSDRPTPRERGTNQRNQGTNPRAITNARLERIERDVAHILRIVQRLDGKGATPQPTTDDRGTFLPGTGWVEHR